MQSGAPAITSSASATTHDFPASLNANKSLLGLPAASRLLCFLRARDQGGGVLALGLQASWLIVFYLPLAISFPLPALPHSFLSLFIQCTHQREKCTDKHTHTHRPRSVTRANPLAVWGGKRYCGQNVFFLVIIISVCAPPDDARPLPRESLRVTTSAPLSPARLKW